MAQKMFVLPFLENPDGPGSDGHRDHNSMVQLLRPRGPQHPAKKHNSYIFFDLKQKFFQYFSRSCTFGGGCSMLLDPQNRFEKIHIFS